MSDNFFVDVERVFINDVSTIEQAVLFNSDTISPIVDKYSLAFDFVDRKLTVEEAEAVLNADNAGSIIPSYAIADNASAIKGALNSAELAGLITNADSVEAFNASIGDAVELRFGTSDFSVHVDTLHITRSLLTAFIR